MKRFPLIIHHLVMANNEERANAQLMMLNALGGDFIDNWILEEVEKYLPTLGRSSFYRKNDENIDHNADVARALLALPAIPWLRGLAKAIRGDQVGRVLVKIATSFATFIENFRAKKRAGSLRRFQNVSERVISLSRSGDRILSLSRSQQKKDEMSQQRHQTKIDHFSKMRRGTVDTPNGRAGTLEGADDSTPIVQCMTPTRAEFQNSHESNSKSKMWE